ncbi:MAG TPA: hypothetical protein PK573_07785 [Spirochaetota bacterium]|nr:hypothetical protein [Spirochaetota bacterium]HRZ27136.1 hypothetical protein [Spirochaetota bacterium]HSA14992.1 hypothetical protein [Spirochaetota bacterium]
MENHRISPDQLLEMADQIARWKEDHKNVILVSLADDPIDIICKVPNQDDVKVANRLADNMDKNRQLVLSCLLYPKLDVFNGILEEKAGIVVPISDRLIKEYGAAQDTTAKKL